MTEKARYTIGFGGGCHWCTEAVFQSLNGVELVLQGYIASTEENSGFSEAVVVQYAPDRITLKDLISIHLMTHKSSSNHSMRSAYRSAIYTYTMEQSCEARKILLELKAQTVGTLITRTYDFREFKPSPEKYISYYYNNPGKPFCKRYIQPKIESVKNIFPDYLIFPNFRD